VGCSGFPLRDLEAGVVLGDGGVVAAGPLLLHLFEFEVRERGVKPVIECRIITAPQPNVLRQFDNFPHGGGGELHAEGFLQLFSDVDVSHITIVIVVVLVSVMFEGLAHLYSENEIAQLFFFIFLLYPIKRFCRVSHLDQPGLEKTLLLILLLFVCGLFRLRLFGDGKLDASIVADKRGDENGDISLCIHRERLGVVLNDD